MRPIPSAKALGALAALALVAPLAAPPAPAVADDGPITIDILGITDLHGHIERTTTTDRNTGAVSVVDPGAVTLACEVSRARAQDPSALFVSVGDNVGGSAFTSAILDDLPTLDILNKMKLDVSAAGNHELDGGVADLNTRVLGNADFPYLSANITGTDMDSEGDGGGTLIKEVNGVKVAFVGVMTDELGTLISPSTYNALGVAPAVATANARAKELKESGRADVVVVLAHADAATLAGRFTGDVDAVLGGHSHVTYPDPAKPGQSSVVKSTDGQDIAIVQADHYGWKLADVSLSYDPATRDVSVVSAANIDLQTSTCTTDAYGVAAAVDRAAAEARAKGGSRVASIGSDFLRGSSTGTEPGTNRGTESTASDLIADSFAAWASSDAVPAGADHVVGLMNPGGVRADFLYAASGDEATDGILTIGEAQTVQPFDNEMGYATLTGAQFKALLAQQWQPGADRFVLMLGVSSNVSVRIDQDAADELYAIQDRLASGELTADTAAAPIADARSRVIASIDIDGAPLADGDSVLVASNAFVMEGGDGYTVLKDVPFVNTGMIDRDVTSEYLDSFGATPLKASYTKRQIGVRTAIADGAERTAAVRLTGLTFSNDAEKPLGATRVRYTYTASDGSAVASDPVAIDTTTIASRPETGQVSFDLVFGADAATAACRTIADRTCYTATIEILDAAGTVLDALYYEMTTDGAADQPGQPAEPGQPGQPAEPGQPGQPGGQAATATASGNAVAEPADPNRRSPLARTGASIGIGVVAIALLVAGGVLLLRRRNGGGSSGGPSGGAGSTED